MSTPPNPGQPGDPQQPYGQQPPYGQQQPYGQQPPAYPSAPPPPMGETQAPAPQQAPTTIVASFWCWVLSAVLGVVGAVLLMGQKSALSDALRNADVNHQLTDSQIQAATNVAVIGALVATIIIGGLYVLFAFKLKQGRNWARIVLLILTILSVLSVITQSGGWLRYVGVVVAVVAVVLSYLKPSNDYVSAVKASRFRP